MVWKKAEIVCDIRAWFQRPFVIVRRSVIDGLMSVTCDFETLYICGYYTFSPVSQLSWQRTRAIDLGGHVKNLRVDYNGSELGKLISAQYK